MSYSFLKESRYALIWTSIVLAGAAAATLIAIRNYRAAHSLLEADPPSASLELPQRTGVVDLRTVSFASRDQLEVAAWYKPPGNGAVVIVTHGIRGDRSTMLPELRVLTGAGYGVLAFDWPGLGKSQGTVRWDRQARRALAAAIDWLSVQSDVDPTRIGGLGFSIGAYVMTQVAADDSRLRAVVLEAAPPNFDDYVGLHFTRWGFLSEWPARWAIRDSGLLDKAVEPLKLIGRIAPRFQASLRDLVAHAGEAGRRVDRICRCGCHVRSTLRWLPTPHSTSRRAKRPLTIPRLSWPNSARFHNAE